MIDRLTRAIEKLERVNFHVRSSDLRTAIDELKAHASDLAETAEGAEEFARGLFPDEPLKRSILAKLTLERDAAIRAEGQSAREEALMELRARIVEHVAWRRGVAATYEKRPGAVARDVVKFNRDLAAELGITLDWIDELLPSTKAGAADGT